MVSAAQLRAARGLLDWTRADLAKAANVSPETIKNIEHGTFRPQEATTEAIIRAFAAHDVEFTKNEGVGKSRELVRTFTGKSGYQEFLDHIYSIAKASSEKFVTRQFNYSDSIIRSFADDYSSSHLARMELLQDLDAKCLVPYGDENFPAKYCEYKWLDRAHKNAIPYYVYGSYVSMVSGRSEGEIAFVSINSELLSKIFCQQFALIWEESIVIPSRS